MEAVTVFARAMCPGASALRCERVWWAGPVRYGSGRGRAGSGAVVEAVIVSARAMCAGAFALR